MRVVLEAPQARAILMEQFPQWADLPLRPIVPGGWDNTTFRLGEDMVARFPTAPEYAVQVEREHRWLPSLARALPIEIPVPVALGVPGSGYPWPWSIRRWIPGSTAAAGAPNGPALALDLAGFLRALHAIDVEDAPGPSAANFHRGGDLSTYDDDVRAGIAALGERIDAAAATVVWQAGRASTWDRPPVWVHGDVAPANLVVREGRLTGVIDFGQCAVGDPACDLVIAWTFLDAAGREAFRSALPMDGGTWARARAWALWKAVIVASGMAATNAPEWSDPLRIVGELLAAPAATT
jgi:aminoglycoside phosphotransferase (APT) family kinase protein